MKFFNSIKDLVMSMASLFIGNETVWRGEDGSYAVGDTFPIDVEEGETEYIEAGTVSEYTE